MSNHAVRALEAALQLAKTRGMMITTSDQLLSDADKIQSWLDDKAPSEGADVAQQKVL